MVRPSAKCGGVKGAPTCRKGTLVQAVTARIAFHVNTHKALYFGHTKRTERPTVVGVDNVRKLIPNDNYIKDVSMKGIIEFIAIKYSSTRNEVEVDLKNIDELTKTID